MSIHSRRLGLVAAAVLTMTACGPRPHSSPLPSPPASVPPSAVPAACTTDGSVTNPLETEGSGLRVSVLSQTTTGSGWDIAFPAETANRFPELRGDRLPDDLPGIFARALDEAGAFTYGSARLHLDLVNLTGGTLTITDVRPVNTRVVCLPSGLLVLYGSEGGDPPPMRFDLEADRPVAHAVDEISGEVSPDAFFTRDVIRVPPGEPANLSLDLILSHRAHAFDIGIDYLAGGVRSTLVVGRANGPFRVMPNLCPNEDARRTLDPDDLDRLRAHRFEAIRLRSGAVTEEGRYVVEPVAPDGMARLCVLS